MRPQIIFLLLAMFSIGENLFSQARFVNYTPPSEGEYTINNISVLNSEHLDYAALPYRNGVVFTSTRGEGGLFSCNNDFESGNYSDLFFAEQDINGNLQDPEPFRGQLNKQYHDGVVTFNEAGDVMYFSRNNDKGVNDKGNIDLKIYETQLIDGNWENIKELHFNSDVYSTCHPSLSSDGQQLYFASNRPGGYGGMDIYMVKRTDTGWSAPVNLGKGINSAGNEIFPFVDANDRLYFASDGHPGMGGLDVFYMEQSGWEASPVVNLGSPINSKKDDFAFTAFPNGQKGFLTSNRKGGLGLDDLYEWEFSGVSALPASICVVDKGDNTRINDAKITISTGANSSTSNALANSNGTTTIQAMQLMPVEIDGQTYLVFPANQLNQPKSNSSTATNSTQPNKSCDLQYPVVPGQQYTITVEKEGYEPWQSTVPGDAIARVPEYLIPLNPIVVEDQPQLISGVVKNRSNRRPLPLSEVKILNKCTGQQMSIKTDHRGAFEFEADCNCDYEMVGLKDNFDYEEVSLSATQINCDDLVSKVEINLDPKPELEPETAPVATKEELSVGSVIRLDKLYYDLDKFNIRPDAAIELDKVVDLLKKYPSLELELGSHTDSRGSDEYNQWLSRKRAESAVAYIISNGIASRRIKGRGYGESRLENRCRNGVKCNEQEHQLNRRTEILVTRFEEEGVRIED